MVDNKDNDLLDLDEEDYDTVLAPDIAPISLVPGAAFAPQAELDIEHVRHRRHRWNL